MGCLLQRASENSHPGETSANHPQNGRVVVIDELDRSLHPKLRWELVEFFSTCCPDVRCQLIVTTHEAHLLDQDLLRRDDYWMVEKDKTSQSKLTPLADFNVRTNLDLRKGYLLGRFDALPIIGDISSLATWLGCIPEGAKNAQKE